MDLDKVPFFLVGKSFGGLISLNLTQRYPHLFRGLSLIVPFFKHKYNTLYKYHWFARTLDLLYPRFKFYNVEEDKNSDYYKKFWYEYEDKKYVEFTMARTASMFKKE